MHRFVSLIVLIALVGCQSMPAAAPAAVTAAVTAAAEQKQLDLITTYAVYSRSIWHDANPGGYWGDGIDPKANGNGAIRGTTSTMLGYAMLIHATDGNRLPEAQRAALEQAGLTRASMLDYIQKDLWYLTAHHLASEKALEPTWGHSWQSPMWISFAGVATLLVWNDLPAELKEKWERVIVSEADRVAAKPPKDAKPGDTGAEEVAWDLQAPAVALAMMPNHASAKAWWRALCLYAVNVYSTPADRTSNQRVGADRVRDLNCTTNIKADFTLDNHNFFHPDYVQVSAGMLGEARMTLALGDALHGTTLAKQFAPYALHHVADVWQNVMRPLFLPSGTMTFPAATDWTTNCAQEQSYLATIATALGDPLAAELERRLPDHALRHRAASPPNRIFGDSNLEWFWEPILVQRMSMAILQHETIASPTQHLTDASPENVTATKLLPNADVWLRRTPNYFVSASWGSRKTATFTPLYADYVDHPYITLPTETAVLPAEIEAFESAGQIGDATVLQLKLRTGGRCALLCFDRSVIFLSPLPLRGIAIENDRLSGAHAVRWSDGEAIVPPLKKLEPFRTEGPWLNIDERLGFVAGAGAFNYAPAGGYNRRAAAIDRVTPEEACAWQMIAGATSSETRQVAGQFTATCDAGVMNITLRDGAAGRRYRITAPLNPSTNTEATFTVQALDE